MLNNRGKDPTRSPDINREGLKDAMVREDSSLKSNISPDAKKMLVEVLKELFIISDGFTGRVVINFGQGGITELERIEKIR